MALDRNLKGDKSGISKLESTSSLESLQIFDRLVIGPVKTTLNRLTAPYRLYWQSNSDSVDLIYKYEEDVFPPNDEFAQNLANMIAAQIAINYGLFCREIVFHGEFDDVDQRFIRDMAENTCREIYVKKFLEFNPFLEGTASKIEPLKRNSYLLAELNFPDSKKQKASNWQLWSTDKDRFAVLSSGGKDSLLSFGLLSELGKDVHPIFINESGRHWFTALNAYRYFNKHIPGTTRVWTNSDRVFNWMVRHIPFIKQGYKSIRFDEYPIRLWTVAVFLFGALPILRKKGISRLIIGDEYDTTARSSFKGITHYNGLFDQSRYFDNVLSRYYLKKGWSVCQFSVLRQLSELLIVKILVTRYPDLQAQQVSCHAASESGGKIYPCGKCEKCRRIVGMLVALDVDPQCCGYHSDQIKDCLATIAAKGVHQETAGARHLLDTLIQKGKLKKPELKSQKPRKYPEIMMLRFDKERSPMDSIPLDIREKLFRIYLEHADGAVIRSGRTWNFFDPLVSPDLTKAYAFDLESKGPPNEIEQNKNNLSDHHVWETLKWPEVQKRLSFVDIAILPVGSIEQHGPHLPLDTDAFDANYLAHKVAQACSDPKPFVLPLISYGVSYEHADFPGTISISNDTLTQLVYEIGLDIAKQGIKKFLIINGHGGNSPALNFAAQKINRDARIFVCVDSGETSDVDIKKILETPNDIHAGEAETSTSLAVRPEIVSVDKMEKLIPEFSSSYLDFSSKRGISWYCYTKRFSPTGIIGDATNASSEKGAKIWKMMIAHLVALIEDVKNLSLEEIFQKKY